MQRAVAAGGSHSRVFLRALSNDEVRVGASKHGMVSTDAISTVRKILLSRVKDALRIRSLRLTMQFRGAKPGSLLEIDRIARNPLHCEMRVGERIINPLASTALS